jgi:hypothetical protein
MLRDLCATELPSADQATKGSNVVQLSAEHVDVYQGVWQVLTCNALTARIRHTLRDFRV